MKKHQTQPKTENPEALYLARLKELQTKLFRLQTFAAASRENAGILRDISWGDAGNIGHVNDLLDDALEFLKLK